jgi:hypothetical protein
MVSGISPVIFSSDIFECNFYFAFFSLSRSVRFINHAGPCFKKLSIFILIKAPSLDLSRSFDFSLYFINVHDRLSTITDLASTINEIK